MSYVYVAHYLAKDLVKIGYTEMPFDRVRQLSRLVGGDVKIVEVYEGTLDDKELLHKTFGRHAATREWFLGPLGNYATIRQILRREPIDWRQLQSRRLTLPTTEATIKGLDALAVRFRRFTDSRITRNTVINAILDKALRIAETLPDEQLAVIYGLDAFPLPGEPTDPNIWGTIAEALKKHDRSQL